MVKVHIISGFLGAGKTTLIKKLLTGKVKNEKIILLENEYGEVGVDGAFMKDAGITVTEMNSGCICCTLVGDFQKAVDELIETYHPDRLLIEPSGVGKLSEIITAVKKAEARHALEIAGCATVVDAGKCRMYMKNFGEFFLDQVKTADTIIFSRTQLLSADRVEKSRALIEEAHPGARVITTPWEELDADMMMEVIEAGKPMDMEHDHHHHDEHCDCGCHDHDHEHHHHHDEHCDGHDHDHEHHHHHDHDEHCDGHDHDHEHHHHDHDEHCTCGCHDHDHDHEHHHHHHADEVFVSVGVETAKRFEESEVRTMLEALADEEEYGQVLRAKGILQNAAGEWFQFDYVPGEPSFRAGTADYTGRLCVIGAHVEEKAIRALFGV